MRVQAYLFFEGRCEEAFAFYRDTLGATQKMAMRFKDNPEPPETSSAAPGSEDKIMHMSFQIGDTEVLASDGRCVGQPDFKGFSLTLTVETEAEADRAFDALAQGGNVHMPMARTFFSPRFGMVADKFGVSWIILVAA